MKNFSLIVLFLMVFACGKDELLDFGGSESDEAEEELQAVESSKYIVSKTNFRGYVLSAFAVTVDGREYFDMEDFYTQELAALPEKVAEAGYEGYEVQLDAQLGISDLWHKMAVYVAPEDETGYQGTALVGESGEFTVELPNEATGVFYKVRANKRINVILSKEDDLKTFCYNFSAIEKSVLLESSADPIILDDFTTHLTTYKCEPQSMGDIVIPGNGQVSSMSLKRGMSKREALAVMGSEGLSMVGDSQWCWGTEDYSKHANCAVTYYQSCQCSISFDQGVLKDQTNISVEKLDVVEW